MYTIRPFDFSERDYEIKTDIWNRCWPEYRETADVSRHEDTKRNPDYFWQRLMVEKAGKVVGFGIYCETWWSKRPGKYFINYMTHPDDRCRGAAEAFYQYVLEILSQREFSLLTSDTREDQADGIRFLSARGFKQVMRYPRSRLDLKQFDPASLNGLADKARQSGLEVYTIAALQERDPDWLEKWYELETEIVKDIPSPDVLTPQPLDEFRKMMEHPHFRTDTQFIAVDTVQEGNPYIGISGLWQNPETPEKLDTGLTGVRRSHRRRGIATYLKQQALTFAKAQGCEYVETDNEENNPMYQINMKLGFEPQPAWLDFEKEIN